MNFYIYGNWKSNGTKEAFATFQKEWETHQHPEKEGIHVGLALPWHLLLEERTADLHIGSQNVSAYGAGAYTGETHTGMLKEMKVGFSLVGHSERRHIFGETVEDTRKKLENLVAAGIFPMLCIGETLDERKAGRLEKVLEDQCSALSAIPAGTPFALAYEPVWAIGTGVAATPDDVKEAHAFIRQLMEKKGYGHVPTLYGGSVKPGNAGELATIEDVHGFLVGGASLKAADFHGILDAFAASK
ncbi:MAG: triose-phosphate isomerase [Acidobacteria bacterium]|nr:MAG: triose-phosphate isomerase [Acidobacteriota bacterium]